MRMDSHSFVMRTRVEYACPINRLTTGKGGFIILLFLSFTNPRIRILTVNHSVENISDTRKAVTVSLTAEETAQEGKEVLAAFASQVQLPGFRPGKAPIGMVQKRYAKDIASEVNSKLTSKAYEQMNKDAKLNVYALVNIDGKPFEPGVSGEVKFLVDVRPEFDLPEYKGIAVSSQSEAVSEEDIDKAVNAIRGQRAEYKPVERAAEKGDYVRLSYLGTLDGKPVADILPGRAIYGTQTSTWEEAGASDEVPAVRAVVEGIVGMKAEDKKTVSQTFAADFDAPELAGKTVEYAIEVKEVREKILPEMNEEFLKSMGADSVEKFREIIKNDIARGNAQKNRDAKRNQVIETLQSKVDFPLPESAIETETQDILRSFMQDQMRHGAKQEDFEAQKEALFAQATEAAKKRVKLNLILSAIAQKEDLKVENSDIQQRIMQEAMMTRQSPDKIVKALQADRSMLANLQRSLLLAKALEFVIDQTTEKAA